MTIQMDHANHEKSRAALSSVAAAVVLTLMKILVGVFTGSLGILAEAAHSGLDLVAALVTFFAVRLSGKPADAQHPYGHGKIENISALFETLLLLVTAIWIIYEAVQRLFFKSVLVEVSVWAFAVMAVSIVIDVSRSRMLFKVAKTHHSQALEADALHFSTDVWSSSVVILGLAMVWLGRTIPGLAFLIKADAVAAAGVALIVGYVSLQMGIRTVQALIDTAPAGTEARIKAVVEAVPGVANCHALRIRTSGSHWFVDAHVLVNGEQTLTEAHALTERVEQAVRDLLPGADITVHPEPIGFQTNETNGFMG